MVAARAGGWRPLRFATLAYRRKIPLHPRGAVALLPVGVMEAHGPHLPIGTDAFIALALSRLTVKYAAAVGREALVAPPFYWGINGVLADFVGSFRVRPETAAMLFDDVVSSLFEFGFREVAVISHHGDLAHNEMIRDRLIALHARGAAGARWLYAPFRQPLDATNWLLLIILSATVAYAWYRILDKVLEA